MLTSERGMSRTAYLLKVAAWLLKFCFARSLALAFSFLALDFSVDALQTLLLFSNLAFHLLCHTNTDYTGNIDITLVYKNHSCTQLQKYTSGERSGEWWFTSLFKFLNIEAMHLVDTEIRVEVFL